MKYCTYLTTYFGNKLPLFYLGFSLVEKVKNGYCGSVSSMQYKEIWAEELLKNKHLFKTKILTIHKTKEEANKQEILFQNLLNVVGNPLYINQSAFPHFDSTGKKRPDTVLFNKLTKTGKPAWNKGLTKETDKRVAKGAIALSKKPKSKEHRRKISEFMKTCIGEKNNFYGKKHSSETKEKMRQSKLQ